MSRIIKEDSCVKYQGIELVAYEDVAFLESHYHYQEYLQLVDECLHNHIKTQGTELFTDAVTILATNGWQRSELPSFAYPALKHVCSRFVIPLENYGVNCSLIQGEWDDMLDYAKSYVPQFSSRL